MEWLRLDPLVVWVLRASLAALFAAAALHKLRDPRGFLDTFSEYEILPRLLSIPGSVALVAAESAIAIGLLVDHDGYVAGLAAILLLGLYTLAIAVNLVRGRTAIDCGCLGAAGRQPLSPWLVVRNGLLAFGAGMTCLPSTGRALNLVDGISLFGGFVTLALLFNAINILAAQTWRWPERENAS